MNSVLERQVVNGVGLGELNGMFNIGKMFTRMFTFTPSSFKLKNIAGSIGSATSFLATGGIANVAAEIAGPSGLKLTKETLTSAHSKPMEYFGYGVTAAAAVVGAVVAAPLIGGALGIGGTVATGTGLTAVGTASSGSSVIGTALAPAATGGGFFSAVGGVLSTVGSGLMTGLKVIGSVLPMMGQVLGGGGGQPQQQGGMTQAEYDAQQQAAYNAQQQAAYDAQVRQQQTQMYTPGGMPISYIPETGQPSMTGMNASYGDLRTPYTGVTQDGEQVQVDPRTGQVISEGMSTGMMIAIGGVTVLAGWYLMSGNKSNN
jgi:hypothetical protein